MFGPLSRFLPERKRRAPRTITVGTVGPGEEGDSADIDAQLASRAKLGDDDAVEELVRRHWPLAARIGYLITRDKAAAEDIAQETMSGAIRSLSRFDPTRPFVPWLSQIATHKAHDWVRRRSRRPEVLTGEGVLEQEGTELLAQEIAENFRETQVAEALEKLDLNQREALVFRYVLDYTPQEIAEVVGVPAATVRTRLFRGLARLREELGERNEEAAG